MSLHTDDIPRNAIIKLHMTDHLIYLRANHILKAHDITMQQALILYYLFLNADQRINQKDIEIFLGISNPSVTSLMKTMVAKKLIRRLPDRTDARSYQLRLTPQSKALQPVIMEALAQVHQESCADLSESEMDQLMMLLGKINQNLSVAEQLS